MNYDGEKFLNRIYKDLHMSEEVMHTANKSDNKEEKVRKYLERLKHVEDLALNSKYNGMDLLKEMFYKKYVIKEENVPESYFKLQKEIALERGYGHIVIDEVTKKEMIESLIKDQKRSLDKWLEYLINEKTIYPEWFKYYAFQGMLKLGSYDKETEKYSKRTDSTTNIFVDLNREALSLTYDFIQKVLNHEQIDDESLKAIIDNGSFGKIYSYIVRKLESSHKDLNSNEGIWIKYNQGDDPQKLVDSLQGKGTGWCTAGYETAKYQLQDGDFYVYYTKDSTGEYKQPRIAIRMDGTDKIGEIRGIASHQNLEPEMEEVVKEKIKDFPDKASYMKKVSDMEKLTKIYKEHNQRELTKEELVFLYEINDDILGFGYTEDPRIKEIIDQRNRINDMAILYNCSLNQITSDEKELLEGKDIVVFDGDLNFEDEPTIKLPQVVGNLSIKHFDANKVSLPKRINGNLFIGKVDNIENLVLPEYIGGILKIGCKEAKGLKIPERIKVGVTFYNLEKGEGIVFPESVNYNIEFTCLDDPTNLILPDIVNGWLDLNVTKKEGLQLPKEKVKALFLDGLTDIEGIVFPRVVDCLRMSSVTKIGSCTLPEVIREDLDLVSLTDATGLDLSKYKNIQNIELDSLTSAKGLKLPKEAIMDSLSLPSMTDTEGLELPRVIKDTLDLSSLRFITNTEGLRLPDKVGNLRWHLEDPEGLIIPEDFKFEFMIAKEKVKEYIKNKMNEAKGKTK